MVGPNCFGFCNYNANVLATRNRFHGVAGPGNVGMVFQSGGLSLYTNNLAFAKGVQLSHAISSGNELVTDTNDYIQYFLGREDCRVIGGSLEQIPDPARFEILARTARDNGQPMVFLKLGRSAETRRLAASHTGSIAGDDVIVDTFLRDLGVIRVDTIEELVETAGLLAAKGWPAGGRTFVSGFSGGVCGLGADLAHAAGVQLERLPVELRDEISLITGLDKEAVGNPLDLTTGGLAHLNEVTQLVGRSGAFDILIHASEEPQSEEGAAVFSPMREAVAEAGRSTGLYGVLLTAADLPPNDFGRAAKLGTGAYYVHGGVGMSAVAHVIRYAAHRDRAEDRLHPLEVDYAKVRRILSAGGPLSEADCKAVLKAYGVPLLRETIVRNTDAAVAAAEEIGYPVVVKVVSPQISHKSDIGGVVLNVRDGDQVRSAYEDIMNNVRTGAPDAEVQGVSVTEQVEDAAEFFVGTSADRDIGPIVVAGLGGIYVEILRDVVTARPPLSPMRAEEHLEQLASAAILRGARGKPRRDRAAFAEVVSRVGQLAYDFCDEIEAIDVNPLFVRATGGGVAAGDALIVLKSAGTELS